MLYELTPDIFLTGHVHRGDVWFPAYEVTSVIGASSTNASTWAKRNLPPSCVMIAPAGLLPKGAHAGGRPPLMVNLFGALLTLIGGGTYGDDAYADDMADQTAAREGIAAILEEISTEGVYVKEATTVEAIDRQIEALRFARARRVYADEKADGLHNYPKVAA